MVDRHGSGTLSLCECRSRRTARGRATEAVYTTRDGLAGNNIFRVFEDSRGDIWIGTIGLGSEDGLARWDRSTGRVQAFSESDGLPAHPVPTAFAEDRAGGVWVGLFHGGLARYRRGRFTMFAEGDGVAGTVRTLFVDSWRLWIGSSEGLLRVDDPRRSVPGSSVTTPRAASRATMSRRSPRTGGGASMPRPAGVSTGSSRGPPVWAASATTPPPTALPRASCSSPCVTTAERSGFRRRSESPGSCPRSIGRARRLRCS